MYCDQSKNNEGPFVALNYYLSVKAGLNLSAKSKF